MKKILFRMAMALVGLMFLAPLHAQKVAVKNNLLYDATLTPNLGIDWRMSDHWTAGLSAGYNPFTFLHR